MNSDFNSDLTSTKQLHIDIQELDHLPILKNNSNEDEDCNYCTNEPSNYDKNFYVKKGVFETLKHHTLGGNFNYINDLSSAAATLAF